MSSSPTFWQSFLGSLRARGLTGVRLVIADAHAGLGAAADRTIQGAGRQRCRVHFIRNLLALVPRTHQHMAAAVFRTVFAQPDPEAVDAAWDEVAAQLGARFPKVYVDATYLKVRNSVSQVVSMAMVVATGVTTDGNREILGCDIGDSESEGFWQSFLGSLRARGLTGVRLVIADAHAGLGAAADRTIQGAGRQRCRVHFIRNLLALVPRTHQHMAAAVFRTVFAQPDPEAVDAAWDEVAAQLGARFPKVAALMADAKPEVLAFAAFPRAHWQKIWSTNPLERINKEIKRRSRVVGIFPNQASAIRLVGAILADLHDEWQATERRYLSEHSMATLSPERDTIATAELTPGN